MRATASEAARRIPRTCAIVLAAGRSRRMGSQKLLLPYAGRTLIGHIVGELTRSAVARIYVVVGADRDRVAQALREAGAAPIPPPERPSGDRVQFVTNPDPAGDMLSSVRCGVRALPARAEAVLVVLGDQPGITASLIDQMLSAFARREHGIVVPVHHGQRGHPLLFSARYREEVLARHDDLGLRGLLRAHPREVLEWHAATSAVLFDVDTPADYARARKSVRP